MFGGADPAIRELVPSDIEFRGNYCFKPLSWKIGHPGYEGVPWAVKNRFVDGFDVQGFAEQMVKGQVGWVLFCIDDHYFGWPCAPNKTFDKYAGYAPGERRSRRDLIAEVADALNARGVKLI